MSLIHWSPMGGPLGDLHNMLDQLHSNHGRFVPAMDVYETDKAVMVEAPLAGVKPEAVEINVHDGVLIIKGESKKEHEIEDKNYYRKEVRSGSFLRQIMLPTAIHADKVTAEFENGVLKIICPKAKLAKAKKINVKVINKNKK